MFFKAAYKPIWASQLDVTHFIDQVIQQHTQSQHFKHKTIVHLKKVTW